MKHPTYDIDKIRERFDCEIQNRQTPHNDSQYAVFYCWLNNSKRHIGIEKGDLIRWNRYGLQLRRKVADIDWSYYDGTCPVLYVKLTRTSYKKLADHLASIGKKRLERTAEKAKV